MSGHPREYTANEMLTRKPLTITAVEEGSSFGSISPLLYLCAGLLMAAHKIVVLNGVTHVMDFIGTGSIHMPGFGGSRMMLRE